MGTQYLVAAAGCEEDQLLYQGCTQKENADFVKNSPAGAMLLQGYIHYGDYLHRIPFCEKMQGIQQTITEAFQVFEGDHIIVQK